ncbi:phospho-sugar mutase [Aquibacillus sp. 3ASR75-11]|uniref:Phosphoglucomutase n=1 Tax=Terrihalobacillus insolitus TaxID=2950438 RepID=A0A9X4APP2_9BACI|nr:phospho-sugar mutase [Terrihalobacillus insolitus]MDC3425740.1 phospho-sugar mutase [Terrihalobacillus insolitus]
MTWRTTYEKWDSYQGMDPTLKKQLEEMGSSKIELEDAFYKELTFGTGGMRGTLGPGTNRMNIYTVRKAVNGLVNYLKANSEDVETRGIAVAYDSRYMSKEFAIETAKVLGAFGITSYVFESLRPTPILSFAVRHLGAVAGVMITASHNPPEYNGFKVYNEDGGQITPSEAAQIIKSVQAIKDELCVPVNEQVKVEQNGLLNWIGEEVDQAYLKSLKSISRYQHGSNRFEPITIVFTPLHGTSFHPVMDGLTQLGFNHVHVVEDQANPDPEFSTVSSPNPEEHQAFKMAIEQGKRVDADILIATDPDSDRLGVAVKDGKNAYTVLSGNQLGTLMLDYLLSQSSQELLDNGRLIKTIVTTEMGRAVASHYGVGTIDTLTGFKFIGEKIKEFETTKEQFLFGYEESYGYLIGDFVRDKDAVQAAMVACEMTSFWKAKGKTLIEALHTLYERHGYYLEDMTSLTLKGKDGAEKIAKMMADIRENEVTQIGGLPVVYVEDYATSERTAMATGSKEKIELPTENVVKFLLTNNSWVCLRPSGTEPKIKCYFGVSSGSMDESNSLLQQLKEDMTQKINKSV